MKELLYIAMTMWCVSCLLGITRVMVKSCTLGFLEVENLLQAFWPSVFREDCTKKVQQER